MALFCLVHGSAKNLSGWDLLLPQLQAAGHRTVLPSLPNDLETPATRYAEVIAESLQGHEPAIVVAHSISGLFLPLVPSYIPLRQLVFLGAMIPTLGMSPMEAAKKWPAMFCPDWPGKDPSKDAEIARHYLFHDCTPEVADWAVRTLELMYVRRALVEEYPLEKWPDAPCSYINCTLDRTVNPDWWRRAAKERLGVEPIEIRAGHCPYISRPSELAQILDQIAQAS